MKLAPRILLLVLLFFLFAAPAFAQHSQAALDAKVLSLRDNPEIQRARQRLLDRLRADQVAASVGNRLEQGVDEIVLGMIQDTINTDRGCPVFFRYLAPAHA